MAKFRYFRGWSVVAATCFALSMSGTTFAAATFGILTIHIGRTFGWAQAAMAPGLSIFLLSATVSAPVVGRLVDRFGSRRIALIGLFAMAAVVAGGSLMTGSVVSLYLFYAAVGLTGAFTNPIAYLRAITLWFDNQRGLAVGMAVAGQGLGAMVLPLAVEMLSAQLGWRQALLVLAGFMVVVIVPVVALFVRDDPAAFGLAADGLAPSERVAIKTQHGLSLTQALGQPAFWLIIAVLALFGLTSYALTANMAYVLVHAQGLSLMQVAGLQSIGGLSLLIGRVVFGGFMDRFHAPKVGVVGVLFSTAGLIMLLTVSGYGALAVLRSVLLGASGGAETDLLTLLVGRYFGAKALAETGH